MGNSAAKCDFIDLVIHCKGNLSLLRKLKTAISDQSGVRISICDINHTS